MKCFCTLLQLRSIYLIGYLSSPSFIILVLEFSLV
uniref:Uncharacterized protein n=1 Tax=Rhizophora mucronata TaxID=61149 RepID=A0A2P2QYM1_RHIMU